MTKFIAIVMMNDDGSSCSIRINNRDSSDSRISVTIVIE